MKLKFPEGSTKDKNANILCGQMTESEDHTCARDPPADVIRETYCDIRPNKHKMCGCIASLIAHSPA